MFVPPEALLPDDTNIFAMPSSAIPFVVLSHTKLGYSATTVRERPPEGYGRPPCLDSTPPRLILSLRTYWSLSLSLPHITCVHTPVPIDIDRVYCAQREPRTGRLTELFHSSPPLTTIHGHYRHKTTSFTIIYLFAIIYVNGAGTLFALSMLKRGEVVRLLPSSTIH
ncbi:hypothetical protein BKA70DRAFT_87036 [Coprinopsis sp. MPI-PUGE-AT-0042]|nr:hypothetical protein BKA70DRAFT_87036 [Coprinopsis sp. MPI-PUGE-AT-0042]